MLLIITLHWYRWIRLTTWKEIVFLSAMEAKIHSVIKSLIGSCHKVTLTKVVMRSMLMHEWINLAMTGVIVYWVLMMQLKQVMLLMVVSCIAWKHFFQNEKDHLIFILVFLRCWFSLLQLFLFFFNPSSSLSVLIAIVHELIKLWVFVHNRVSEQMVVDYFFVSYRTILLLQLYHFLMHFSSSVIVC